MEMSSEKEILALEDRRYTSMTGGDYGALEALLHDELLYTHSSGRTDTKASWLDSLRCGKTRYKSAVFGARKVRMLGDTALVTGDAHIEAEIAGQPRTLKLVFLNVWTQTPKGWKFIAWQSTPQPT
jgi:ketosteroid isomerase-like protein